MIRTTVTVLHLLLTLVLLSQSCGMASAFAASVSPSRSRRHQRRRLTTTTTSKTTATTTMAMKMPSNDALPATITTDQERDRDTERRHFLTLATRATAAALASLLVTTTPLQEARAEEPEQQKSVTVSQFPSGLKYIDIVSGTGPSPAYGQLCTIQYTASVLLPASSRKDKNAKPVPQVYDQDDAFLLKHGNGRTIPGLDEGLHTMAVGGTRRLLIPPKLGYIDSGLGPIPSSPFARRKLNQLLEDMIELKGGTLIVQVTLRSVRDDEADQGYYSDLSPTPQELERLQRTQTGGIA